MQRASEDLPEPETPMTARHSPGATLSWMSRRMGVTRGARGQSRCCTYAKRRSLT